MLSEPSTAPEAIATEPSADEGGLLRAAITSRQAMLYAIAAVGVGDYLADSGAYYAGVTTYSAWLSTLGGALLVFSLGRIISRWASKHVVSGSLMSYINLEAGPRPGLFAGAALLVGYVAAVSGYIVSVLYFGFSCLAAFGVNAPSDNVSILMTGLLSLGMVLLVRLGVTVSVKTIIGLGYLVLPVAIVVLVAAIAREGLDLHSQVSLQGFTLAGLVAGVVMTFGFYAGFEGITALGKETADPKRVVPRVVTTLVVVLFVLILVSVALTMPLMLRSGAALAAGDSPIRVLSRAGHIEWLAPAGDGLLTLGLLASGMAYLTDASRVTAASGTTRLLPSRVSKIHSRHHTPTVAIAALGVAAFAMVAIATKTNADGFFGSSVAFTLMAGLAWLLAYTTTAAVGAFVAKRERRAVAAVAAAVTAVALLGIVAYQVMHAGSTFGRIASFVTLGVLLVLWVQAMLRRDPLTLTEE